MRRTGGTCRCLLMPVSLQNKPEGVASVVAIIPARGGSKGIPKKNILPVNGLPLIVHSIESALASTLINRVIVSTDSEEIRDIAVAAGAEVPFLRPPDLSGDLVLDLPVFKHALMFFRNNEGYVPDVVVHLRPTSPYRRPEWIDDAIRLLQSDASADSVRSVSEPEKHPYRMFTLDGDGYLDPIMKHLHPVPYLLRRQDLPKVYFYNCVIDVTSPRTIFEKHSMTGDKILPYIMNSDDVIDIDTRRDLKLAELFFKGEL